MYMRSGALRRRREVDGLRLEGMTKPEASHSALPARHFLIGGIS